jgi:four helix bundle protein
MFEGSTVLARFKDARRSARRLRGTPRPDGRSVSLSRAALRGAGVRIRFAHGARGARKERTMLRIHDVMLEAITTMQPVVRAVEKGDRDLASQLRRASSSVVLNIAEGSGSAGGIRLQRYRTALGSARETWACLQVARAAGYVASLPASLAALMNRVIGTLVRVAA